MRFLRILLGSVYVVLLVLILLGLSKCSCSGRDTAPVPPRGIERNDTVFRHDTVYVVNNTLVFRTVDAATGLILPDCDLTVLVNDLRLADPNNSGNGAFRVEGLANSDVITIVASKDGYGVNNYTVNNAVVGQLLASTLVDIPLRGELEPCNASAEGKDDVDAFSVYGPVSYNMGVREGRFDLTYNTGGTCSDCIDIYNHEPGQVPTSGVKIFSTGQVAEAQTKTKTIQFNHGSVISIVVTTGDDDGSYWKYEISCPY